MGGDPVGGGGPKPLANLPAKQPVLRLDDSRAAEILKASEAKKAQVNALLEKIASGKSNISIDTASFLKGIDPDSAAGALARAEAEKYMGYLKDLAKTEAGLKLLTDLDAAPFKTTIMSMPGHGVNEVVPANGKYDELFTKADGTASTGGHVNIYLDTTQTTYAKAGEAEQPWMTERQRYGMYHEMVHCWHAVKGELASGEHKGIGNWEWQAMGMGPYSTQPLSDNIIRKQMGKAERPNYSGVTY